MDDKPFAFQFLESRIIPKLKEKDVQEFLTKWSMAGRINAQAFSFDKTFHIYEKDKFISDFLNDLVVCTNLKVMNMSEQWTALGTKPSDVTATSVACTEISMAFFDRLYENNIARENGRLCKCFDEFIEDFVVADELRKMLLDEDSENYDLFSVAEKDEFLYRLFSHFCLGGSVCQYEDTVEPYVSITKGVYKDLLSVNKDPQGGLYIASHVFKIKAKDEHGQLYYPDSKDHRQTFSYLIVDPMKRNVVVLYHKFGASVTD